MANEATPLGCLATVSIRVSAQMFADMVLVNGRVRTENPRQPETDAVAILGGRIAATGSSWEIRKLAGPPVKVIDLEGKRGVPGFNDAHVHFVEGARVRQARHWATPAARRSFAGASPLLPALNLEERGS